MTTKTDSVVAWLGPRLPANLVELHAECLKARYSLGDLRDAKRVLGVATVQREGKEFWFLPGQVTQPQPSAVAPASASVAPAAVPAQVPRPSTQLSPEAARAELARRQAILALPQAIGCEGLAMHLANNTSMSVDEARATLEVASGETCESLAASIINAGKRPGATQQQASPVTPLATAPEETVESLAASIVNAGK